MENVFKISELEWSPKPIGSGDYCAVTFDNGYTASVLRGGSAYTTGGTYEIAVINAAGKLDYSTPITGDVLGYLSEKEADEALVAISELPVEN